MPEPTVPTAFQHSVFVLLPRLNRLKGNLLDGRNRLSYPTGMSKPARAHGGKGGLPFEEALKKLEGLVEAMESGDLPLETLLARYEEGTRLVKICQDKLAEAELKIRQLEKNAAGEMKLKPVDLKEES
jgi:exodeoxyribonuclease VII small subunit